MFPTEYWYGGSNNKESSRGYNHILWGWHWTSSDNNIIQQMSIHCQHKQTSLKLPQQLELEDFVWPPVNVNLIIWWKHASGDWWFFLEKSFSNSFKYYQNSMHLFITCLSQQSGKVTKYICRLSSTISTSTITISSDIISVSNMSSSITLQCHHFRCV